MQRKPLGTVAICLSALVLAGLTTAANAKDGPAARFTVVDAQGISIPTATVIVDNADGKVRNLFRLDKDTWLLKASGNKASLIVRDGRLGGPVELVVPPGDIAEATFRVQLTAAGATAELISVFSLPSAPSGKQPPLPTFGRTGGEAQQQQVAPANDDCTSAESISIGGSASGSTATATNDAAVSDCGTSNTAPDVWYSVIGDGTTLTASLCNSTYDTKISVYCSDCAGLVCVGGNDDDCGLQSSFSWCSEAGTEYLILVHGFSSNTGDYTLDITSDATTCSTPPVCVTNPPPPNDDCVDAATIAIGGSDSGDTTDATVDNAPFCGTSNTAPGVWYSVIGDGNTLTASLCNSSYDTKISVYCNDCADLFCVDGNDDSCSLQSEVSWCSEMGREYLILVHGFSSSTGPYTLDVTTDAMGCASPPVCTPPSGACCVAGSCDATNLESECDTLGGTWFVGESCPAFACPGACAGDVCASAITVGAIPFNASGNTCTCTDDYDEICPFDAPGSTDLVYAYTPAQNECVDITLCNGSNYDTKLTVYEDTCGAYQSGVFFACNDDECPDFVSELTGLTLTGGVTYYIVVDGYGGDCGDYVIDITPCAGPCDVVCGGGTTPENEPNCGLPDDTVNGGCNSSPTVYSPISCGEEYCGTAGTDDANGLRDTDWYEVTVVADTQFTWTVTAEFEVAIGLVETIPCAAADCALATALNPFTTMLPCDQGSVTIALPPGTYWWFVAPLNFSGVPCGAEYTARLDCAAATIDRGACCLDDGTCLPDLPECACEGAWEGNATVCMPNPCPQPAGNDECADAVVVGVPSTTPGTTSGATIDSGFTSCPGASITSPGVWFEVTGTGNTMTASLCNGVATYDSKISVYCPNCIDAICVIGNDDACGLQSEVSWCSAMGETYLILVHGFGGDNGPFELEVFDDATACSTPPSCQRCPGDGDCCDPAGNGTPSCNDETCCNLVCDADPFCCDSVWDSICAGEAAALCLLCAPPPPTGACCNGLDCTIQTEEDCVNAGSRYLGDDTDCAGGGAGTPTVYEEDVNLDIPDGGGPADPVTRTLNVPDSFNVGDVNVDLIVTHTWVGDIIVTLEHNATVVTLINRMGAGTFGCSEDNFNIILDDQGAGGPIEDQCAPDLSSPPNYVPDEALSAFVGMDSAGDWILTVSDNAGADTGTLDHWSLHIDLPGGNPCIPTGACCIWPDSCDIQTQENCENAGGVYLGDDTVCDALGPFHLYEADVNQAIPDGGGPADPVTHTINVPDSFDIADVDVDLVVTHTWVGDLIVTVEHNTVSATIVDRPGVPAGTFGCGEDNLNIILDDEGTGGAIEDQCSPDLTSPPNYTPEAALSVFDGMDASGDWIITVSDNAGFDTGTLDHWSLHLTEPGPDPCEGVFPGACCDGNTGLCTDGLFEPECVGDQLSWHKNELCADLNPPCVQHRGACCDGLSGVCTDDILPQDCTGYQQVWSKGELCSAVVCVAAVGACCDTTPFEGGCRENVTLASCQGEKETWHKDEACAQITCIDNVIPTVSGWGIVVMLLLLLVAGKVYFGYRRRAIERA